MIELTLVTCAVAGLTMALIYFINKAVYLQSEVCGMESKLAIQNVDLELKVIRLECENGDLKCQLNK